MISRRGFLGTAAVLLLDPPTKRVHDRVLLVGDSLAYGLGPRLAREARLRGHQLQTLARGGSSAHQWLDRGWLRNALRRSSAPAVLVSLGTNCTRSERPKLEAEARQLVRLMAGRDVLWLLPPPLWYSTEYLESAIAALGVDSLAPGPLPMGWDGAHRRPDVHPTDAGYRLWAALVAARLWPSLAEPNQP